MDKKLYRNGPEPWDLEPQFAQHMAAMTDEDLHNKGDIATELAYRDKRIAALQDEVERLKSIAVELSDGVDDFWNSPRPDNYRVPEDIMKRITSAQQAIRDAMKGNRQVAPNRR